ncbi:MAG: hypothetical protein AAFX81_04695 [Pseudomonadota bacterium]
MHTTKFARDHNGASIGIAHWKWGSRRELPIDTASNRLATPLVEHLVLIAPTTACHVRLGAADVLANDTDPVLQPGTVYQFPRASGETHVALVAKNGAGTGTAEVWEADTFNEE